MTDTPVALIYIFVPLPGNMEMDALHDHKKWCFDKKRHLGIAHLRPEILGRVRRDLALQAGLVERVRHVFVLLGTDTPDLDKSRGRISTRPCGSLRVGHGLRDAIPSCVTNVLVAVPVYASKAVQCH